MFPHDQRSITRIIWERQPVNSSNSVVSDPLSSSTRLGQGHTLSRLYLYILAFTPQYIMNYDTWLWISSWLPSVSVHIAICANPLPSAHTHKTAFTFYLICSWIFFISTISGLWRHVTQPYYSRCNLYHMQPYPSPLYSMSIRSFCSTNLRLRSSIRIPALLEGFQLSK